MADIKKRPSADVKKRPSSQVMQRPSGAVDGVLGKKLKRPVPDNFFSREFLTKHIKDIVAFYEPRAVDETGGFFQSFYVDGEKFNPGFRQIVSSARMVINFMLAGKVLERKELIDIGKHGLDYLEKVHYIAEKDCYAFTVRDHKPEDLTEQAYGYAFVLAAHAAALTAGAAPDGAGVARVFELLERKFWLPERRCYRDTISAEGVPDDAYRGQNSNMHMCEALIAAYEATREARYLERAEDLAETFTRTLAAKADGFVWEHYTGDFEVDWEYNKNDPTNIYRPWGFQPGHQSEWAKNLLNIHRHAPKAWMVERARELFDGAWALSYDAEHGGLVYGFGPDKKWCDEEKYFWVQAESMATAALLHKATGEAKYVEWYVKLWHYCWEHWVDHEHGGWVGFKLTRQNERLSEEKAIAGGKCDYHTLVACIEALRAFQ
uniref:N-acylglucosamine 2-epimerase n=1 Tax=Alexandrium monilatum TaxID=311494 RepID=A0A7S4PU47_9DINO